MEKVLPPRPRKHLGQNFLRNRKVIARIVKAAAIRKSESVLEIGAGRGELTRFLAETGGRIFALEIDQRFFALLKDTFKDFPNVKLIEGDILKLRLSTLRGGRLKVVGNLPYYITSDIITHLLEERESLHSILITVQKEVAERLTAPPGGRCRGRLSCLVQYYTRPEILFSINRNSFQPPPKVTSSLVRMTLLPCPRVAVKNEEIFFRLIKESFRTRRKMLLNCLSQAGSFGYNKKEWRDLLGSLEIDSRRRPETLTLLEFAKISNKLSEGVKIWRDSQRTSLDSSLRVP